jgi:hypothetical protein
VREAIVLVAVIGMFAIRTSRVCVDRSFPVEGNLEC